jgi:hypothetical protein
MNSLKRFYLSGAELADRRVAAVLARPSLDAADQYLKSSVVVTALDRMTIHLQDWWLASEAKQLASTIGGRLEREPAALRRQRLASILLIAVSVYLGLTLLQGAHSGWFWMIIPALAAVFAAVLLAASRAVTTTD